MTSQVNQLLGVAEAGEAWAVWVSCIIRFFLFFRVEWFCHMVWNIFLRSLFCRKRVLNKNTENIYSRNITSKRLRRRRLFFYWCPTVSSLFLFSRGQGKFISFLSASLQPALIIIKTSKSSVEGFSIRSLSVCCACCLSSHGLKGYNFFLLQDS